MTKETLLSFDEWAKAASPARTGDPLWTVQAYRLGLYAVVCHTHDRRDNSRFSAAGALSQLTRSIGSIAANIAEGYSRSTPVDRIRFYSYALGSAREAISWYDTFRFELGDATDARQATLIQVRRLLLTTIRKSRPEGTDFNLRDFDAASLPAGP